MIDYQRRAYLLIGDIVGCKIKWLPLMSPEQFACSDWEWVGVYQSTQDIRECMMGVWEGMGANPICPTCGRYAYHASFTKCGRLPDVFECVYCKHQFGPAATGEIKPALSEEEIAERRMIALFGLFKE